MKFFLCLLGLIFNGLVYSQMIHEWINTQYNPSEASEVSFVDYLGLHGAVKSVHETQELIGANKEIRFVSVDFELQRNGFLKKVHKVLADGSESINEFTYLGLDGAYQMFWTSIFNEGVRKDTIRKDVFKGDQRNWQIRADSTAYNSAEKIVYFRNNRDEVYTTYDKYGRKVKDSIPANPTLMAHEITYQYRKRKIVKLESYSEQKITIKSTFKIDNYGNWIKCKIESNRNVKNAVLHREITYFN